MFSADFLLCGRTKNTVGNWGDIEERLDRHKTEVWISYLLCFTFLMSRSLWERKLFRSLLARHTNTKYGFKFVSNDTFLMLEAVSKFIFGLETRKRYLNILTRSEQNLRQIKHWQKPVGIATKQCTRQVERCLRFDGQKHCHMFMDP